MSFFVGVNLIMDLYDNHPYYTYTDTVQSQSPMPMCGLHSGTLFHSTNTAVATTPPLYPLLGQF